MTEFERSQFTANAREQFDEEFGWVPIDVSTHNWMFKNYFEDIGSCYQLNDGKIFCQVRVIGIQHDLCLCDTIEQAKKCIEDIIFAVFVNFDAEIRKFNESIK